MCTYVSTINRLSQLLVYIVGGCGSWQVCVYVSAINRLSHSYQFIIIVGVAEKKGSWWVHVCK